jgi:hypothetical protein
MMTFGELAVSTASIRWRDDGTAPTISRSSGLVSHPETFSTFGPPCFTTSRVLGPSFGDGHLGGLVLRLIPAAAGEFGRDMIVGTGAETVEPGARASRRGPTSGQTVLQGSQV